MTTQSDTAKYWRTSIAIPHERRPEFDRRLAALGFKTLGDLATFFIVGDGVIEALRPLLPAYQSRTANTLRAQAAMRRQLADKLSAMTPEQMQRLLAMANEDKEF